LKHGLIITHGAGSNRNAPLLVAIDQELSAKGVLVERYDLPFRRERPHGSPFPAAAKTDREGIREAAQKMRSQIDGLLIGGGHSYGGRQTTMVAAESPELFDALLLLSYPLHPPNKPQDLRTAHFPNLRTRALFIHGSRDPFGTEEEMRTGLKLIPAPVTFFLVEGAGHDLAKKHHPAILSAVVDMIPSGEKP
jgi:predicted alpha/beta-hydrolase family hydrolase